MDSKCKEREEERCLRTLRDAYFNHKDLYDIYDETSGVFASILESCTLNPAKNDFPDYLFEGGAMEHFFVGASRETRKGSDFKREEHQLDKELSAAIKKQQEEYFNTVIDPEPVNVFTETKTIGGFSYNEFLKSLERNCSGHFHSLNQCKSKFEKVVFLMEQQTSRFSISKEGTFLKWYEFHKDKKVLSILKKYSRNVHYFVYFAYRQIEIIDSSHIDRLLESSVDNDNIHASDLIEAKMGFVVDWGSLFSWYIKNKVS